MRELAEDERAIFLGQSVACAGTFMSMTLEDVPLEKRIEMPVAEELQLGISIGMAMTGLIPITIYPRFNFILCAMNQLVNHVDKMKPHIIVRVGVGSEKPLYPGPQHVGNFTEAFRRMMPNTKIIELERTEQIMPTYKDALERNGPTVLVEIADLYES